MCLFIRKFSGIVAKEIKGIGYGGTRRLGPPVSQTIACRFKRRPNDHGQGCRGSF
jgi:hypothetical protein